MGLWRVYIWNWNVLIFCTEGFPRLENERRSIFTPTPARIVLELVIWLGVGLTVGAYGAPERKA